MSIFSSYVSNAIETPPVFEGYTEENYGDILALEESYADYESVIESIYLVDAAELDYFKKVRDIRENMELSDEEKEEMTAEAEEEWEKTFEAQTQNIFQRMVNMLKNLWGKIKSFFENVGRSFMALVMSGKSFAEKYEKDLLKLNLSGFKYEMFKYTNIDNKPIGEIVFKVADEVIKSQIGNVTASSEEEYDKKIEEIQQKRADIVATVRGKYVDKGQLEPNEYASALYAYFRGGAINSKDTVTTNVDIKSIINVLKNDKIVKDIKKAINSCNNSFNKAINEIKDVERLVNSDNKDDKKLTGKLVTVLNKKISIYNETRSVALTFFRAWRNAVHERERVYKSVCLAAFRYKGK